MKCAACITLVVALASLPTAADDKSHSAIAEALVKKVIDHTGVKDSDASDKDDLAATTNAAKRSTTHGNAHFVNNSLSIATCPMGTAGAPTFAEVQNHFRHYTDNEMWRICLNRSTYPGAISGGCACTLLAYPNPWRPVDTPHTLEHEVVPPGEEPETVIEPVPEDDDSNK
jgi:hypothetical protein